MTLVFRHFQNDKNRRQINSKSLKILVYRSGGEREVKSDHYATDHSTQLLIVVQKSLGKTNSYIKIVNANDIYIILVDNFLFENI